jgi:outer membrane receptor protein involved in Fe transport
VKRFHHISILVLLALPCRAGAEDDPGVYEVIIEVDRSSGVEEDEPTVSGEDRKMTTIRAAAPSAAELLNDVQGVEVRRSGTAGHQSSVSIRGSDGQQTQIRIDGVAVGGLLGGGSDLSVLPVWGIGKLRILRGGLSDRAGSDALGGLIELQTRAPGRKDEARTAARVGSFGFAGVDGLVAIGGDLLSGRLVLSSMLSAGDFPYLDQHGQASVRENADTSRNQVMLNLAARPSGWGRVRATQLTTHIERGIPGPAQFPTAHARQEATHLLSALNWSGKAQPRLKLHSTLAHRMERSHYWDPTPNLDSTGEQRALMHRVLARAGITWFPNLEHELGLEAEGRVDRGRVQNAGADELLLGEHRVAVALRETWSRGDWIFYGGLRAERWSEDKVQWAPRVGFRWTIHDDEDWAQSLRSGLGRAYRIPSLSERHIDLGSVRGNPDLLPEIGWSADLGWTLKHPWGSFALTPFATYYQRSILFMPQSFYVVQADNARDALALGVESMVGVRLPRRHKLVLGYTYARARFREPDVRMPGRPEHSGHVTLLGKIGSLQHELMLRGRSSVTLDRFGGLKEEGHIWLDANLAWEHEAFALVLRAQNLLDDQSAVDHLQQALPGRAFFLVLDMGGRR